MKPRMKNLFLLPALMAGLGMMLASRVTAQTFTTLHSFTSGKDGATPFAGVILSGNTLYGTTYEGGSSGNGTVFSLSLPRPQLTIVRSGANVILTWPTNAAGFALQSAPAITGTFTNLPAATSPYTNPTGSGQKFFRLISN